MGGKDLPLLSTSSSQSCYEFYTADCFAGKLDEHIRNVLCVVFLRVLYVD